MFPAESEFSVFSENNDAARALNACHFHCFWAVKESKGVCEGKPNVQHHKRERMSHFPLCDF